MKQTLIICLLGITLFSSCKKDDSPNSQTVSTTSVNNTVVSGSWRVTYYNESGVDKTNHFSGYAFNFNSGGAASATNGGTTINGSWASGNDDSQVKFILSFSSPSDFIEISEDWHVLVLSSTKIQLQHVSGGSGSTDYLTFERN